MDSKKKKKKKKKKKRKRDSPFFVVDCTNDYSSSSYQYVPCDSPIYSSLEIIGETECSNCSDVPGPSCCNNICAFGSNENFLTDSLALHTTDGLIELGQLGHIPKFVFLCFDGLGHIKALRVNGMAGLGSSNYSLPTQVSIVVPFSRYFVLCLFDSRFKLGPLFLGTDHTLSFDLCYEAKDVTTTPMGPSVPTIDLIEPMLFGELLG
ncbi:basic 7s globulin [Quercus suber]|uniref:Basic 7s globulin n=1 Tax=Quercus suber TaxID=58331 RepID=A0AAW0M026_QUESU